jgi:hypothetical protein
MVTVQEETIVTLATLITASMLEAVNGLKTKSSTQEMQEAAVRCRVRVRSAQKVKDVSFYGTVANSMRLLRGGNLLAIDLGRAAETYDAKNALERERAEQSAPQRHRD